MAASGNNTTSRPGLLSRRWAQLVIGLAVLLVLLLVLTPYLMTWMAQQWLLDNGADTVEIRDIDFNPFTGSVVVEQLKVEAQDRDTLVIPNFALDIDWSPLFSRRAHIRTVTLDSVHLTVEVLADGGLRLGGVTLPGGEAGGEDDTRPWDYGIVQLDIRDSVINYNAPGMQLVAGIETLSLRDLSTWASSPAPLTFQGSLNGAEVVLDGQLPALTDGYGFAGSVQLTGLPLAAFGQLARPAVTELSGRMTLDTRVDIGYRDDRPLQVEQDGLLRLEELQFAQAETRIAYGRLEWQGKSAVAVADRVEVSTDGALSGDGLGLSLGEQDLGLQTLRWQGTAGISAADNLTVRSGGRLAGSGLEFVMPAEDFRLRQGSLEWDGQLEYSDAGEGDLRASGRVKLEQAQADPVEGDVHLVGFEALTIDRVGIEGLDAITVDTLEITGARLAESMAAAATGGGQATAAAPLEIASLGIDRIEIRDRKRVSIDTIESREARYTAQRDRDGKWRMATILESLPFTGDSAPPGDAEPSADAGADAEPGSVRVGVLKNTDVVLRVEDDSVSPPFRIGLSGMAAIRDFDTARPDQDTHVYLKVRSARHDSIEVKGTVRPLASPLSLDLETHIDGLEMPPLSPYAIASIGHRLDSGQLDAKSTLRIDRGQLDGMNELVMKGLKVSPVKGDELEQMQSQLAVPLDKGLDMLRDDHDVIRLKLPLTGDLENPEFDAGDAINQAVAKATKEGAIASLSLLLQPYGSLITVARYAADKASAVRLDPVVFEVASSEVPGTRQDYLEKVADIIRQRPQINIRLCGIATEADRAELLQRATAALQAGGAAGKEKAEPPVVEIPDEQLIQLADDRDAAVKEYLVSRLGVEAGRLVACQPAIDPGEAAEPRVDLLI